MEKITDIAHLIIKDHLKDVFNPTIIDATCGNGHDTLFLVQNFKGNIHAYDIQEIAINNTKELTKGFDVTFHLASYEEIDQSSIDLVLFNLGYLPNGNKEITTKASTTLNIVKKLVDSFIDNPNMLILLIVYPLHEEGGRESQILDEYTSNLDKSQYDVLKIIPFNKIKSPYILTIRYNKNTISL